MINHERPIKVLLTLIRGLLFFWWKGYPFKALLRYDSTWLAELLIQCLSRWMDDVSHNPEMALGFVQWFLSNILAIWGSCKVIFFGGGPMVYSLVALAFPRPIQGWNLMISDYISRAYPGLSRPLPIALTRVHPYPLTSRPKAAVQNDHEWPLAEHDPSGLQGCQPSRRPLGLIRCEFGGIWPEGTRGVELCWNYG